MVGIPDIVIGFARGGKEGSRRLVPGAVLLVIYSSTFLFSGFKIFYIHTIFQYDIRMTYIIHNDLYIDIYNDVNVYI